MQNFTPETIASSTTTLHQQGAGTPKDGEISPISTGSNEKFEKDEKSGGPTVETVNLEALPEGADAFHRLTWPRLAIVLIVEAIALGSLGMPSTFATLGLVPALLMTVGIGSIAIYSSYLIGQVKLKYPQITDYADSGKLMFGKWGYRLVAVMLVGLLTLTTGSHVLTGTIAFNNLSSHATCNVVWSIVAAVILYVLALPKSFHDMSILGYIDFCSIILAIGITIIATGIEAHDAPGGLAAVEWYAFLPADKRPTFAEAMLSVTNIVFAFAYAQCQFSFQSELAKPKTYMKAIWSLGLIEIFIYSLTGSLIYVFVGERLRTESLSPALLAASPTIQKVAFGVAIPVIFISGAINTQTASRFIFDVRYKNTEHQYFVTRKAKTVWIALCLIITLVAWLVAELIPFFGALLGLISSLFIAGFTFTFPALFYFRLLKEGKWNASPKKIALALVNACILAIGIAVLVLGTYASAVDIKNRVKAGAGSPFSCGTAN